MTRISVELKELHGPWLTWCQAAGLTPSEAIRRLVLSAVGGEGADVVPAPNVRGRPEEELRRHELRMTEAEAAALAAAAHKEGMSSSRYLVCLLRAQLLEAPPYNAEQVEVLAQSNRLLMGLVTAMNRAARDPSSSYEERRINLAQIQYLKDFVDKHVRSVSALLTTNSRRWRR